MIKKFYLFILLALSSFLLISQTSENIEVDFDLEALPGLIEKANNFEELEEAINKEDNSINNLDLDNNGEVDYVLIQEEADGDTHIAFLRVAVAENEFQDIATIEMEKQSSTAATFQIVGDVDLYGEDYILEPEGGTVDISESADNSGGKKGPSYYIPPPPAVRITICVGVFRPGYAVWVSPWGFGLHPVWFRPWRPIARATFMSRSARWHRKSFRRTSHRRSMNARNMHKKGRKSSKSVHRKGSPGKSGPNTGPSKSTKHKQPATTQQKKGQPSTQHKKGGSKQRKR